MRFRKFCDKKRPSSARRSFPYATNEAGKKPAREKKADGVYIMLYQAHQLKAKIKARETKDDFEEDCITFAKVLPCNDHQMKIIFGSVDFNAFVYITFVEPEVLF